MKKLFAVLLAVAMLCTMSISAFAATTVTTTGDTSASLTVKYTDGTNAHGHAATITWGSMEFTYTSGGQKWNTEKMIWEDNGAGTWGNASTVKVSNRSSEAITVKFGFTAESDAKGVTGIMVNGNAIVADGYTVNAATAGTNGNNGTATESTFSILPTGTYTGTNSDAVKVGTITITLE